MTRSGAEPGPTQWLAPLVWTGFAVAAALVAAFLAGVLDPGADIPAGPVLSGDALRTIALASIVTRALTDLASVAAVGLGLTATLVPLRGTAAGSGSRPGRAAPLREREGGTVLRRSDRAAIAVAAGWLVAVLASIVVRTAEALGVPLQQVEAAGIWAFVTLIAAGRGLVLTALCALGVLGCTIARLRKPDAVPARVVLVIALLGAIAPAVTGHTGSAPDHQLAVVLVAVHAGAAALWVGGLAAMLLLIAPRPALLAPALPRFSLIATACIGATALTGLANAALRLVVSGSGLVNGYGALVLAKTVLIGLIGLLGLVTRRRLAAGRLPVLRWAGLEVAAMAVTLGLAATLSQTAP